MNSLALIPCSVLVCLLFQEPTVGWQLDQMRTEPILAVKLYVLLVLCSIALAVGHVVKNWRLLPPFRHVQSQPSEPVVTVFRRQALSLQRWMILNALAWATATTAGLIHLFRGEWNSSPVEMRFFALGLEEVLRPAALFFVTLIVLYVVRWHILWRAERLERLQSTAAH